MSEVPHNNKEVEFEVVKPRFVESALGNRIELSNKQELGGYCVGDIFKFKRENKFTFGEADVFSKVDDEDLSMEIIGITRQDTLVLRWVAAPAFIDECTVEQLDESKIND
jgi:hypothetical protein